MKSSSSRTRPTSPRITRGALGLAACLLSALPAARAQTLIPMGATHPQLSGAEAALMAGRGAEAEQMARAVIAGNPDVRTNAQAWALVGQAARRRGDTGAAAEALRKALANGAALGAARPALSLELARVYRGQGKLQNAKRTVEAVLHELPNPELAEAYEMIAEWALTQKQDARAGQALDRAWRRTDADGQLRLRALAARLGASTDPDELRIGLAALKPTAFPAGHLATTLAERAFDAGQHKEAAAFLDDTKEAIGHDPSLGVRVAALRGRIVAAVSTPVPPPLPPTPPPLPPTPSDPFPPGNDAFPPAPPSTSPQPALVPPPVLAPPPVVAPPPPTVVAPPTPWVPQPPPPVAPPLPASNLSPDDAAKLARVVRPLNATTWQIERRFADGVFSQNEPLGRCSRIYESERGYRMMCVEPGGLFEKMGLRQGDILMQVNEHELTNGLTVFLAMGSIRSAPQLVTRILRDGQVLVHTYVIR